MESPCCAAPPWPAACHARRVTRLFAVVVPLLAGACATSRGNIPLECERGEADACSQWGPELLRQGEPQQAENAFVRACEGGYTDDCISAGKLMMARGELSGAEAPLSTAYQQESEEATWALADLYQARGAAGDSEQAARLRYEAPAIDKPDREFFFEWRPASSGRTSYSLTYAFQPMALASRRLMLGLHFAWNAQGGDEFNAVMGYQHFMTSSLVPYATLLLGGAFQKHTFNVGGEVGMKWCLGPFGHLRTGVGSSVASPLHASIGIGINSLPIELLVLLAAH
ncbi:hypothetical protein POL68_07280 [Stigmatella sp. ncwal1]|uniref:Lipoprotein n=1 Tax=Stigmatella ashevillensis TaxID=2995309 RepID=A0ABT5D3M1_9BACT|nr:hypothetical protein [Stigmatella ashevillena]MDC0708269.1 hypothetical protein [Stigmatella ashevillena]